MAPKRATADPVERKICPVCKKSCAHREILRHIGNEHPEARLKRSDLDRLGAKLCLLCNKVVSSSGKGKHDCKPIRREFEISCPESSAQTSQGTQSRPVVSGSDKATDRDRTDCIRSTTSSRTTRSCRQTRLKSCSNRPASSPHPSLVDSDAGSDMLDQ